MALTYYNDFSNYPLFSPISTLNYNFTTTSNNKGAKSEVSGYVSNYVPWGTNCVKLIGTYNSGQSDCILLNSSTPNNFVFSARFSYSGSNYQPANSQNVARLMWGVKTTSNGSNPMNCFLFQVVETGALNVTMATLNSAGTSNPFNSGTWSLFPTNNVSDFTLMVVGSGNYFQGYINNILIASGSSNAQSSNGTFGFGARPGTSDGLLRFCAVGKLSMDDTLPPNYGLTL